MVQTTIFLSPESAAASSPLLLLLSPLIVATTPVVRFEIEDRFLQLRVDHVSVRDDQHGVEQLVVLSVMQIGQKVSGPRNRVRLAGAGRVLNQVLAARSVRQHGGLQCASGVELVIPGEDDRLDLLLVVLLSHQIPAENLQPALPFPDLFPQVRCPVSAVRIQRIARRSVVALIERQEHGLNGRNTVSVLFSRVVIRTSRLLTAK